MAQNGTALVLSAGGMFGAWQAGAWTVLARALSPGAVIGASAGALNGWLIAGGVAPEDLTARWTGEQLAGIMRLRFPWKPWNGVFAPAALETMVRELFAAATPRVPFGAALVEVPRLRRVLVRSEEMTWRHLLASCSIPLGFPAVRIGEKAYVDGGLLGALPLWACAEMGISRALALDALPLMPSRAVRTVVAAARRIAGPPPEPAGVEVFRLAPSRSLGSVRDAVVWDPARVRALIDLGTQDAEALLAARPPAVSRVFD